MFEPRVDKQSPPDVDLGEIEGHNAENARLLGCRFKARIYLLCMYVLTDHCPPLPREHGFSMHLDVGI